MDTLWYILVPAYLGCPGKWLLNECYVVVIPLSNLPKVRPGIQPNLELSRRNKPVEQKPKVVVLFYTGCVTVCVVCDVVVHRAWCGIVPLERWSSKLARLKYLLVSSSRNSEWNITGTWRTVCRCLRQLVKMCGEQDSDEMRTASSNSAMTLSELAAAAVTLVHWLGLSRLLW